MRAVLDRRCATRGIAVSGYGSETDVQQSLEAGFSAHLVKPVEFEAGVAALEIEAIAQFAIGRIHGIGQFVFVDLGNDIEAGHGGSRGKLNA